MIPMLKSLCGSFKGLCGARRSLGTWIPLSILLGGCSLFVKQPEVRLAIVDWPAYEYFYLASKQKLDHQLGYQLSVQQYGSLQDQRLAYSRGDVDAIATTLPEAIAICRDVPRRCPVIVLVLDRSDGADQVIASNRFTSTAQLKGQRVGLENGILGEFMLLRALQRHSLKLTDVQVRYGGPKQLVDLLQEGTVAAIVTYSPHSDVLLSQPRWRVLFSSRDIPGEVVDVLAVSRELAQKQKPLVQALINTWWEVRQQAAEQPTSSVATMAQRQGVSAQEFVNSQRLIAYPSRSQQRQLLAQQGPVQRTLERLREQMQMVDRLPASMPMPLLQPEAAP